MTAQGSSLQRGGSTGPVRQDRSQSDTRLGAGVRFYLSNTGAVTSSYVTRRVWIIDVMEIFYCFRMFSLIVYFKHHGTCCLKTNLSYDILKFSICCTL